MPSDNFISYAKKTDSIPVALVAIESLNARKLVITTRNDWFLGPPLPLYLSMDVAPGSITLVGASPATMTTRTMDFVTAPVTGLRVEFDDITPAGATLTYIAYGSNDFLTWTNLGAVTYGQLIASYRAYKFDATFTSSGSNSPVLREIRLIDNASQYTYFSTRKDCPMQGAKPYLKDKALSQLSSKIELDRMSSVGEMTINLHFSKFISDYIATGQMVGKVVVIKIGYDGLSESEFEPYFTGSLYDYSLDHDKQVVSVKTRDVWKQFNRNVPANSYFLDGAGKKDDTIFYEITGHVTDAILQIAFLLGVPDRYLDRDSFAALKTLMPGTEYNVTRRLTAPEEADKLIGELATSFGILLFPLATGQMTARLYDSIVSAAPLATLDARRITCKEIEGGQKDFVTRVAVYYQLTAGAKGSGNKDDYEQVYYYVDAVSESAWGEVKDKEWMDAWAMSGPAIERLTQRLIKWYAIPRKSLKVENVPSKHQGIAQGSLIAIDYLQLPAPLAQWPGYSSAKTFIITSKTLNPDNMYLTWELQEADPLNYQYQGLPTHPAYAIFPTVSNLTATERISKRTDGTIDTYIELSWSMDFRLSSVTLYVNEDSGGLRPIVNIPARAGTGLYSFLARDGVPYVFGVQTINAAGAAMPLGNMPTVSITPLGKAAPPANVSGIVVTARGDFVEISWNQVSDADCSGYKIRIGATWETGAVIVSGVTGNAYLWKPTQTGNLSIMIKALDTTGHESAAAATSTLTVTASAAPVLTSSVMDNQVMLSWTPGAAGTFPVKDFEIRKGASWAAGLLIGTTAGTTLTIFEISANIYTYWVAARDASSTSAAASISVMVSSPPNFIFKGSQNFALTGARTNALIDGAAIVLPVNTTETVADHFTRVAQTTPQGQITAGYPIYIQPGIASGSYIETLDFGGLFASTKITLNITAPVLSGSVSLSTIISVSPTNLAGSWTDYNGSSAYASNFRYVKVTITATTANGGVIAITGGQVQLEVRMQSMEGTATANAADVGGTTVYITDNRQVTGNAVFLDVESIQVSPKATIPIIACYDFTDISNPNYFKVLLFQQSNGARYTGDFSFLVRGV